MKNINLLKLSAIFIGILVLCFYLSKMALTFFSLQSDFLSASATFFAAVVAVLIFNGWKEPHRASKILSERNEILVSTRNLRREYYNLLSHIRTKSSLENDDPNLKEYKLVYLKYEGNLLLCLDELKDKLLVYKDNLKHIEQNEFSQFHPAIDAYITQLEGFYAVFMQFDPLKEFDKAHNYVVENFDNKYFSNLILSLTVDLRDYLISQKIKGH